MQVITDAFALIKEWNPTYFDGIKDLQVTLVKDPAQLGVGSDYTTLGGYDSQHPGQLDLNVSIADDVGILAETIVHEGCHEWDDRLGQLDEIIHVPGENKAFGVSADFAHWYVTVKHGVFTGLHAHSMELLVNLYTKYGTAIDVCRDYNPEYCKEDAMRQLGHLLGLF